MKTFLICVLLLGVIVSSSYGRKCRQCSYQDGYDPAPTGNITCKDNPVNALEVTCDRDNAINIVSNFNSRFQQNQEQLKPTFKANPDTTYHCGKEETVVNGKFLFVRRGCITDDTKEKSKVQCGSNTGIEWGQDVTITTCLCAEDNCNGSTSLFIAPITLILAVIACKF